MQYHNQYPYDTVSIRYMADGEASVVIERSARQMDRPIKPSDLYNGDYYWKGIRKILCDFNIQVTSMASQASYENVEIECDSLLANEVTKQLYKSGWYNNTTHDHGNDMVTIVVDVHKSMLKYFWDDVK